MVGGGKETGKVAERKVVHQKGRKVEHGGVRALKEKGGPRERKDRKRLRTQKGRGWGAAGYSERRKKPRAIGVEKKEADSWKRAEKKKHNRQNLRKNRLE